ncbi:MAG TPA: TetR/AcrR family transcriptional regulator [Acidimicrobiales bacterium]|nr:TetR/AcrR family transcriptional regulator [Acidimicrobiales bacterium]
MTRDAISRAARDILVAEGLHAVSLRRVAGSLGVTAPALYAHVIDKRDLLQGIVEQEIDDLLRRFDSVADTDPTERLRTMCQMYVDYALQNPDLFRAMFLFRPELTAEPRGDEPALGSRIFGAFLDAVRDASSRGSIRDGDPQLGALTVWSSVHGVVTLLLSGPPVGVDTKAELSHAAINTTITGLQNGALIHAA